MIIFKNNKIEVEEPENTTLNGVYYAVVINTQYINESVCICYVYVPEIHGPYNHIFSNAFNFPRVEVPIKQDNDDPGYTPQTGDVIKVSFDDGDSNSCRFLMLIPIPSLTRLINADYINKGILPSGIIENITDPQILDKVRGWLPQAYFITTGAREPTKDSFIMKALITANTRFSNYFLVPLTIPMSSNSIDMGIDLTSPIPMFSTNLYLLMDIIYKLYDEQPEQLISLYRGIMTAAADRGAINNFNALENDTERAQFVAALLSGMISSYIDIMFPDADRDHFHSIGNTGTFASDPRYFYQYSQTKLGSDVLSISEYYYNNKGLFENEWVSTISSWWSGLNNIIDKNNVKLIKVVLYCLTICPWLANAIIRYSIEDLSIFSIISAFHEIYDGLYNRFIELTIIENSNYSTIFKSNEEFVAVGSTLRNVIDSQDLNLIINTFEQEMKKLVDGKVGGSHIEPLGPAYGDDRSYWDFCEMSQKFTRLRNTILPEILAET